MKISFLRNTLTGALAACLLAACGPSVERAYSNCVEAAYQKALVNSKNLVSKDGGKLFESAARVTAEKQCSFIRQECVEKPQGDMCQRLINQYGK